MLNWDKIVCCRAFQELAATQCLANNLVAEQLSIGPICVLALSMTLLLALFFAIKRSKTDRALVDSLRSQLKHLQTFMAIALATSSALTIAACVIYFGTGLPFLNSNCLIQS